MAVDPEWVEDLFSSFGRIRLKRMFSGYGVYTGDFCIALVIAPGFCFRVDEQTREEFEAVGAAPFVYGKQGKIITVQKWWAIPEILLDEPDEIVRLARLSLQVAQRLPPKKKRVGRKAKLNPDTEA